MLDLHGVSRVMLDLRKIEIFLGFLVGKMPNVLPLTFHCIRSIINKDRWILFEASIKGKIRLDIIDDWFNYYIDNLWTNREYTLSKAIRDDIIRPGMIDEWFNDYIGGFWRNREYTKSPALFMKKINVIWLHADFKMNV